MQDRVFPFGQPIIPMIQKDQTPKRVFVLGVYASAVHARWILNGKQRILALAVASEPEIFWRGSKESAKEIISKIQLPQGAGCLEPASEHLNGPSGVALGDRFLTPLGIGREQAWLCDLVPYSCMNGNQAKALETKYDPVKDSLNLPDYYWPELPVELASPTRRNEIEKELLCSEAEIIITLGDEPLKWFAQYYGSASKLAAYGRTIDKYGQLHPLNISGRQLQLLPLVHPRQAARLGLYSKPWADLHDSWVKNKLGANLLRKE